ncbi:unnamed protein product [Toxocara canis]|uniref:Nucleoporin_N domain-containing protein n=1 Tax=Toxocara canis TaxID=6265 RepID=A0A183V606_TOXCA|nr:unnamed protein product [Toxocara canis]
MFQLVVACEDRTISFFSAKGRRQNQMKMDSPIRCIDAFVYAPRQYTALLVALDNEVRIYRELFLMDRLKIDCPIKWIRYGPMGREEGALVVGSKMKLFRRTAKLDEKCEEMGPPAAQNKKLNVPRRTKIFVDQTIREREQAQMMHQISVEINGFGPTFRLIVKLRVSSIQPLESHWLTFHYNEEMYAFDDCLIPLPALVPGMTYVFNTLVHCLNPEKGLSSDVRVLLSAKSTVIVAALVTMPISEVSLLD